MGLAGTGYYGDLRRRAIEICCLPDLNKDVEGMGSGFQIVNKVANKLPETEALSCLLGSSLTRRTEPAVAAFGRAQFIRPDVITDGGAFDD